MSEPPPPSGPDDPQNLPRQPRPEGQPPDPAYGGYPPQDYPQGYGAPGYGAPGYGAPGYGAPGYGAQGYGAQGYPPGPPAPGLQLSARLGARLLTRPEARFGPSLAAAGAALVLFGAVVWTGGYLGDGLHVSFDPDTGQASAHGAGRRFLGAAILLLVTVAGFGTAFVRRTGPLATAGAVAGAFGVPLTLVFVSIDPTNLLRGDLPFNADLTFLLSIVVWLVAYFALPGVRGRAVFLGLAAADLVSYIAVKAAGDDVFRFSVATATGGGTAGHSSTGTVTAIGLIFGLGYYAIAAFLDRRGRSGPAIALVFAGFEAVTTGILAGIPDLKQSGTGVLLIVVGLILAFYGGYFGRRFTTWVWSGAVVLGIILIVDKISPDNYTAAGISLLVVGVIVAAGAQVLSTLTHERPDVVEPQPPVAATG